jgi:hypothetical protein
MNRKLFAGLRRCDVAGMGLSLLLVGGGGSAKAQGTGTAGSAENFATAANGKFYCNVKALSPAERARHKQLTERLISLREVVVETAKGYEFQFSPTKISLAELADWVAEEGKCCPFFDFHIDLEREGKLLCLRLTGEEGVKGFIRMEFGVGEK